MMTVADLVKHLSSFEQTLPVVMCVGMDRDGYRYLDPHPWPVPAMVKPVAQGGYVECVMPSPLAVRVVVLDRGPGTEPSR